MLFDLRGRGRRRTIQGIYLFLAVLMGGGLIFFGVGGTGVGLFNSDNNNGSSSNVSDVPLKQAEQAVKAHPNSAAAWANLARRRFQTADYDSNTHVFTKPVQLQQVAAAYQRYAKLETGKRNPALLQQMITVYGETGLQQYDKAVPVAEALAGAQPKNVAAYEQLAIYAQVAGQQRKADLAKQKAVSLVDGRAARKNVTQAIKGQVQLIQQIQAQEAQQSSGGSSGGSGGGSISPSPGG
jgi:tetratricopeptide (TPR) repeat protein